MNALLEDIIRLKLQDFSKDGVPPSYLREQVIETDSTTPTAIFGVRRAGKTSLMHQTIHTLEKAGISRNQILWFNCEDDRLARLDVTVLQMAVTIHAELFPASLKKSRYFFFDEIQEIDGWEKFIRRLSDTHKIHIFISGSSAKLLSEEIHTSLRGRSVGIELFPLSFLEYSRSHLLKTEQGNSEQRAKLDNALQSYIQWGGFPGLMSLTPPQKQEVLENITEVMLLRDVIERNNISQPALARQLMQRIIRSMSCLISTNKLYRDMKSQGFRIGVGRIFEYVDFFRSARLFYPVKLFTPSVRKQSSNPYKVYLVDHAFSISQRLYITEDRGLILENIVALHLIRRFGKRVYYYKTKNVGNKEVDFLFEKNGALHLIQVAESLIEADTRKRELSALLQAMLELELENSNIIVLSESEEETITSGAQVIQVLSLKRWLLKAA